MFSRLCFINLSKDKNGLFVASNNIKCAYYRSLLKRNSVQTMLYTDKDMPSLSEICEDILSVIDSHIAFCIDNDNALISKVLQEKIRELDDSIHVINFEGNNRYTKEIENFRVIKNRIGEELFKFVSIKNEYIQYDILEDFSPYLDGMIGYTDLEKYEVLIGISDEDEIKSRKLNSIKLDIDNIIKHSNSKDTKIEFVGINLDEYQNISELISCINSYNIKVISTINFEKIDFINDLTNNVKSNVEVINYNQLEVINGFDAEILRNIETLIVDLSLLEEISSLKLIEKLKLKGISIKLKSTSAEWINISLNTPINELNKSLEYTTYSRGFLRGRSGEYVGVPLNGYTKHVEISKEMISDETLKFIDEICSINSSVYINDFTNKESDKYLVDGNNNIREFSELTDKINRKSELHNTLPINSIVIDKESKLQVGDLKFKAKDKFKFITYVEAKKKNNNYNDWNIIKIQSKEDYDMLLNDVEIYLKTNRLDHSPLINGILENSCRFLTRNYCSVEKLPRVKIDYDGKIYPCNEICNEIGTIKDSYFELVQNSYIKHEHILRERNCIKCIANAWCPKCTQLPEYIEENYCNLIKNKSYISDFILESRLIGNLSKYYSLLLNKDKKEFLIATEFTQVYLKGEERGKEIPFFNKYICVINCNDIHLIWSPNNDKYYRISKPIALIAEALLLRWNIGKVPEMLQGKFDINKNEAAEVCNLAYKKFSEYGLLHRSVR